MEFADPQKLSDGRYFVKATGSTRIQLNRCSVQDDFKSYVLTSDGVSHIKNVESIIVQAAIENTESWFGQVVQEKKIEKAFSSSLSGDSFEVNLYVSRGNILTTFWDADKKPKDKDSEWSNVDIIVEILGVKIAKKNFEPIFRVLQVKESSKPKNQEYMFDDEDDDISELLD
jgi:hypothetical protein